MEGKVPAKQEDDGVPGVVAAFRAADVAIHTMLSCRGVLDFDEVTRVLSQLSGEVCKKIQPPARRRSIGGPQHGRRRL